MLSLINNKNLYNFVIKYNYDALGVAFWYDDNTFIL
jgi:hypothetical protein